MVNEHERNMVEAFLLSHGHHISSVIEWRESPDALVQLGDELVGIEVTRLVEATPRQPTAPQQWKREAERIVIQAQKSFERRHEVALVVGIAFRPEWRPPTKQRAAELVDELATLVYEISSNGTIRPSFRPRVTHPDISSMFVGPTDQSLGDLWTATLAGDVRSPLQEDVLKTVGNKEPRLKDYRLAAPDVWLLIDCDLSGQGLTLDLPAQSVTVCTGFDRVFCCAFSRRRWVEVRTVPPKTSPNQAA
jgi:hypothetical protein